MIEKKWWGDYEKIKFPHIVASQQFERQQLETLFKLTAKIEDVLEKERMVNWLYGNIVTLMFWQPSTRTFSSFAAASVRLGASIIPILDAGKFSSHAKGESLQDTAIVMSGRWKSDLIVVRHPEIGSARSMAKYSRCPLFNGGDGPGQHPTQALLDLYTIQKEYGKIDGLKIAMVGDLLYSRTVRSLCYLLSKFDGVKIFFVSPESIRMKDDIKEHLTENKIDWKECTDLKEVAPKVSVIYQTRIQKEYFSDIKEYEEVRGIYIINNNIIKLLKDDGIIMHPLPRIDEIAYEVDKSPNARYFEQADNGDVVRMALLLVALNPTKAEELMAMPLDKAA